MLILQALTYIEGKDQTNGPIWNYATRTDTLDRVLNQIELSKSTTGECASMQVVKQPEHGELQSMRNKHD